MSFMEEFDHLRIPFEDILHATNNFAAENFIGKGGLGKVYQGELLRSEGTLMCVFRRLDQARDPEFWKEVMMLSGYRHENIVYLVGFCNEPGENVLVYEFQTYGSLDKYLSSSKLTWLKRLQICLGAAKGLSYLHDPRGTGYRVIHRDIRSSNILLDKKWRAKIADLGLSKPISLSTPENTFLVSNLVDTTGYRDPLYMDIGILTKESDVYSFGVVLFEVLCGRLAITADEGPERFLSVFARQHYKEGTITAIIDPLQRKQMNPDSMKAFSTIAYRCVKKDRMKRPTIFEIVEKLKEVLDLQEDYEKALALQQVSDDTELQPREEDGYYKKNCLQHWKIPFEEIHAATNEFHPDHRIGLGGFGGVYKAELFHFDVREYFRKSEPHRSFMVERYGYPRRKGKVAIKRLHSQSQQGRKEFLQEIKVLSRLNHENLVSLLGFCDEKGEMMLVYEYAYNGSLDKCIQKIQKGDSPPWQKRLQICLDIAHGLNYLHKHNIQHRDMKSANILLGRDGKGMIADFGLSRIKMHENSQLSKTSVVGTPFCVDPKYVRTGILSNLSDIFSLGVILLEVLFGRQAFIPMLADDPEYLVHAAERHFQNKQLLQNIDRHLREELEKSSSSNFLDSINTFVAITYQCLHATQDHQLTMENVVHELKRALIFHSTGVEALPLKAIDKATNCFSEEHVIGIGASGKVYKGELSLSNGPKVVAMKKLNIAGSYGEGAFLKEVTMLSSYIHENIIPLRGFCEEGNEKIIILEHATNSSLDKHLDNPTLTWGLRLKISIGAAKGLHYIHTFDEAQYTAHGDIKSSNILLDHDWKATISDFIIAKGNFGTLGYIDPLQTSGGLTKESDVYSFGVVLFEILSGRLGIEKEGKYPKDTLHHIVPIELESNAEEAIRDEQVVFRPPVAAHCFEDNRLEAITFNGIKEQTDAKSIYVLSDIAYQCLRTNRAEHPTMAQVLEALENAYKIHEEWESEKKLPPGFEQIIKMSRNPTSSTITKKDLYSLLSSGILLEKEKMWFSLSKDGTNNVMISAKMFSYKNIVPLKWRSIRKSRFPKVARMSDTSNLNIHIQIRTQILSPGKIYGAYLVFKCCDQRKVSGEPLFVNLKYKTLRGTSNAYIADWIDEEWMKIELETFMTHNQTFDFDILLKSFSVYTCRSVAIFIEGIAFQAIDNVDHTDNMKGTLNTDLEIIYEQQLSGVEEIIKRSKYKLRDITKGDLCVLLSKGILIDDEEKLFSLSKVNGKKCHMIPAREVIYKSHKVKCSKYKPSERSRFSEGVELQSHQAFRISCHIETQMLSPDTTYACYLVFELPDNCMGLKCPVRARNLLLENDEDTTIFYFRSPSPTNSYRDKRVPRQREDGWMEVIIWEFFSNNEHNDHDHHPMDLKLVCLEGSMSGLIICGVEFRPI